MHPESARVIWSIISVGLLSIAGCQVPTVAHKATPARPAPPSLLEVGILQGHKDSINALAFTPDGRYLISAGYGDFSLRSWDVRTRKPIHSAATENRVKALVVSRSGEAVITGDAYGNVIFWGLTKGRLSPTRSVHNGEGQIQSLALSRNGRALAVGSYDRTVTVWDSTAGPLAKFTTEPGGSSVVAFSSTGKELVTAGQGPIFAVRDLSGKVLRALVVSKVNASSTITAIAYSPDGDHFATAHNESTHTLWDPRTWRETHNTYVTNAGTMAAAFSPDGKVLATAQHGSGVHLWDSATGREIGILKRHAGPVESIAFSPDGTLLATGSRDKTIRFWHSANLSTEPHLKTASKPKTARNFQPL